MRLTAQIHYPADPATVFAMLGNREFQERKLAGTGSLSWEVEVTPTDGGLTVHSRRSLPTDQVPEAFRSFVGSSIDVVQTETWSAAAADGSRTGSMVVQLTGAPIQLTATLSLAPDGAGASLERVDGELKARVPLLGGTIERNAEPAVRAAIDAEERIGREWLASH